MRKFATICFLALCAMLNFAATAHSQAWPTRPVKILVGFAPGGTADILARIVAASLSTRLGQSVIVENRPGASGAIAASEVARAGKDDHTFLLAVSSHASLPAIRANMPYDTIGDFHSVVFVGTIPLVMVVKKSLDAQTFQQFIAEAKANPERFHYAIPGIGLSHHFAGELLKQRAGIHIGAVPYSGTGPALNDVIAGHVDMTFATLPSVKGAIDGKLVRPLAITGAKRAATYPSVPTVAELGFPGFEMNEWFEIVAPAATSDFVIKRLNQEINALLGEPKMQEWMAQNAVERGTTTPEGFDDFIAKEITKLKGIAVKANIKVD